MGSWRITWDLPSAEIPNRGTFKTKGNFVQILKWVKWGDTAGASTLEMTSGYAEVFCFGTVWGRDCTQLQKVAQPRLANAS